MSDSSAAPKSMKSSIVLQPGEVVDDRFTIISKIGSGGFAAVYKAKQNVTNREVALKIMDVHAGVDDPTYVERFAREALIAAKFQHRNVVTVFDFGTIPETGQPYIAMELLNGHDLEHEIYKIAPLAPARLYKLFLPVLEALGEGHKLGIVHKDLKPANLFLMNPGTEDEYLKIVDFGVARVNTGDFVKLTAAGQLMGTPRYLAPEYIKKGIANPSVDVYQMALIMSEALSGRCAVDGLPYDVIMKHCAGEVNLVDFLKKDKINEVMRAATCLDHTMRYQDCSEFADAMKQIKPLFDAETSPIYTLPTDEDNNNSVTQEPPSNRTAAIIEVEPREKTKKGVKGLLIIIICIVVLAIAGIGVHVFQKMQQDKIENAKLEQEEARIQAEQNAKNQLQKIIDNENALAAELEIPPCLELNEVMRILKERADQGDLEVLEKLALYHVNRSSMGCDKIAAYEYLSKVPELKTSEAYYKKAELENERVYIFGNVPDGTQLKEVLSLYKKAAQNGYEPALERILDSNFAKDASRWAYEQLLELYMKNAKAPNATPETIYKYAVFVRKVSDIQDIAQMHKKDWKNPSTKNGGTFFTTLKQASDLKYPPAVLDYALFVLENYNYSYGLDLIKQEASEYNPYAASFMFKNAIAGLDADYNDSSEAITSVRQYLSDQLLYRTNEPLEVLNQYLDNANNIDANTIMQLGGMCESRTDANYCTLFFKAAKKWLELEKYTQSACNLFGYVVAFEFGINVARDVRSFNDDFYQTYVKELQDCYKNALAYGNNYTPDGAGNYSTSYILYNLYHGSDYCHVLPQSRMQAAAIVHGAKNYDGLAQLELASWYRNGTEFFEVNKERACYWATQANTSAINDLCRKTRTHDYDICDKFNALHKFFNECYN